MRVATGMVTKATLRIASEIERERGLPQERGTALLNNAAPDLLAAAGAALSWWHSKPSHFGRLEPPWVQTVREAIVKARGPER